MRDLTEAGKVLWVVRIIREAYVLAANEEEALAKQKDIERWEEYPAVEAELWRGETLDGWDDSALVYTNGLDTTFAEARAIDALSKAASGDSAEANRSDDPNAFLPDSSQAEGSSRKEKTNDA